MFAYQQQPRGLKISGVEAAVTGTVNDTVVAFTAAAVAGMTNLGQWPITGASSWVRVLSGVADGTVFRFLREGTYEVEYMIPYAPASAQTPIAALSFAVANSQLTTDPRPANSGIFAASGFTSNTVEGYTLRGTQKIYVSKRALSTDASSSLRLQMSDGAGGAPVAAAVNVAQVTLSIVQINHLWG